MNEAANIYRTWILAQNVEGLAITPVNDESLKLESDVATGCANFYDIDGTTIVELRLENKQSGESIFFLHFELDDIDRAKQLFKELCQAHAKQLSVEVHHILLCCTCGVTTTFFANKLNECAQSSGLDYDFCAMPVEEAMKKGEDYDAVLLAPQVGHMRKSVVEALPGTLVIEIPGAVFGSYDAKTALNLVVSAVSGRGKAAASDLRMVRYIDRSKRVLAVSYVYRQDEPTLSYCVLDHGKNALQGMVVRQLSDEQILDDLSATLLVEGYPMGDFDAVGIGVPGKVDNGVVLRHKDDHYERFELAKTMSERWGVPVFVDNNATAAAAGCYMAQTDWDDVAFHAQTIGVPECSQGMVIGGLPRAGRAGFAGSLKFLLKDFPLSMDLDDASWRYDGTLELVTAYLVTTICCMAPQAIFVWCDLLPDMDRLREEICKKVPEEMVPDLVAVSNYDDLVLMGELSLCLQRLSADE